MCEAVADGDEMRCVSSLVLRILGLLASWAQACDFDVRDATF